MSRAVRSKGDVYAVPDLVLKILNRTANLDHFGYVPDLEVVRTLEIIVCHLLLRWCSRWAEEGKP